LGRLFDVAAAGLGSQFRRRAATFKFALDALASGRSVLEVLTVGLCVAALALVFLSIRQRVPWPLIAYGVAVLIMDLALQRPDELQGPAHAARVRAAHSAGRRPGQAAGLDPVAHPRLRRRDERVFGAYSITAWPYAI